MVEMGQEVAYYLPDEGNPEEIMIVGWVSGINEEGVEVTEAWAHHRIFGGSTLARGNVRVIAEAELVKCPAVYKRIAREVRDKQSAA